MLLDYGNWIIIPWTRELNIFASFLEHCLKSVACTYGTMILLALYMPACIPVHYAIYLETWTRKEVIEKISTLFSIQSTQISEVFICDKKTASPFLVILTDDVVQNMVDESQYIIEGQQSKLPLFIPIITTPPSVSLFLVILTDMSFRIWWTSLSIL